MQRPSHHGLKARVFDTGVFGLGGLPGNTTGTTLKVQCQSYVFSIDSMRFVVCALRTSLPLPGTVLVLILILSVSFESDRNESEARSKTIYHGSYY